MNLLKLMNSKIFSSPSEFLEMRDDLVSSGTPLIFTNGCFDIVHIGHIEYLRQAKDMGGLLIVALNSDDSVSRLKGNSRPINCLEDRLNLLSELICVDFLTSFSEDTPLSLIKTIRPDILVKGGDYHPTNIVGYDFVSSYGGSVRSLAYIPGKSTSSIISLL